MFKRLLRFFKLQSGEIKIAKPDIVLVDEFVDWLTFANAGMLNRGNLFCIDYVAKNLNSESPIVEIGSFCGLSTNLITYYFRKYRKGNKLFTSDKWEFEGKGNGMIGDSDVSHSVYKHYVKDSFKRNVNLFSFFNLPYAIEVFSDDFFAMWQKGMVVKDVFERDITLGGSISFAFIDGNHSYDYAKRDFKNVHQYLEPGGFILFDDSSDNSTFECKHLMKEIEDNPEYELVIKNPNYLFRKND